MHNDAALIYCEVTIRNEKANVEIDSVWDHGFRVPGVETDQLFSADLGSESVRFFRPARHRS